MLAYSLNYVCIVNLPYQHRDFRICLSSLAERHLSSAAIQYRAFISLKPKVFSRDKVYFFIRLKLNCGFSDKICKKCVPLKDLDNGHLVSTVPSVWLYCNSKWNPSVFSLFLPLPLSSMLLISPNPMCQVYQGNNMRAQTDAHPETPLLTIN